MFHGLTIHFHVVKNYFHVVKIIYHAMKINIFSPFTMFLYPLLNLRNMRVELNLVWNHIFLPALK